jgi:hypothetical protein
MRRIITGTILAIAVVVWEGLNYWTLADAVLQKLNNLGPVGILVASLLMSRIFALVLAMVAIALLYSAITTFKSIRRSEPLSTQAPTPSIHIENNPRIEFNPVITSQSLERPRTTTPKNEPSQIPLIDYVQAEGRRIGAVPVMAAIFRNAASQIIGEKTPSAKNVTASLTYRIAEQNPADEVPEAEIHISFGLWLNSYTRYANFGPGTSDALLITVRRGEQLFIFDEAPTVPPSLRAGAIIREPNEILIPWTDFSIEIFLISNGTTLFHDWLQYECESSGDELRRSEMKP